MKLMTLTFCSTVVPELLSGGLTVVSSLTCAADNLYELTVYPYCSDQC